MKSFRKELLLEVSGRRALIKITPRVGKPAYRQERSKRALCWLIKYILNRICCMQG